MQPIKMQTECMNKLYGIFLLIIPVSCLSFMSDGWAAPSVKRFGGTSTYSGANQAVSAKKSKNSVGNNSQNSSGRTNRSVSLQKNVSVKSENTSNTGGTSRLSVGKYLHGQGVKVGRINPVKSVVNVNTTELEDLTARIDGLETQMQNKVDTDVFDDYKAYIDNNYATKNEVENQVGYGTDVVSDWERYKPSW